MNNDLQFINKSIDECIYTIRNYQVMLDSDIAFFFGVETKNLNRQMKRNIDRFPEDGHVSHGRTDLILPAVDAGNDRRMGCLVPEIE